MKVNRLAPIFLAILAGVAWADPNLNGVTLRLLDQGFDKPLYVTHDGSRTFLVEQPGRVRLVVDGKAAKKPYLDVVGRVYENGECGFLSVAFHPKFAENGRMFVDYTRRERGRGKIETVISEFHADPRADAIDPGTEKILLLIDQPQANHNGGQLQFGPDGMLYIGMGDGGNANDEGRGHVEPGGNAQNHRQLLGKMLRIDVSEVGKYAVPKDNPFVAGSDGAPEIWATGLRNPWRFSFDRKTGICYAGDVGQNKWEEIDIITRGGNYGWRIREGLHEFRNEPTDETLIEPIVEYDHSKGVSITGGYVYRGKAFAEWEGVYFYGDFGTARIWALEYDPAEKKVKWKKELPVTIGKRTGPNQLSISSFGEDADGELYVCDHGGGRLYQMVPTK